MPCCDISWWNWSGFGDVLVETLHEQRRSGEVHLAEADGCPVAQHRGPVVDGDDTVGLGVLPT